MEIPLTQTDVMGHDAKYPEYWNGDVKNGTTAPNCRLAPLDFTLHLISGPAEIILCPHRSSYPYNNPQLKK